MQIHISGCPWPVGEAEGVTCCRHPHLRVQSDKVKGSALRARHCRMALSDQVKRLSPCEGWLEAMEVTGVPLGRGKEKAGQTQGQTLKGERERGTVGPGSHHEP